MFSVRCWMFDVFYQVHCLDAPPFFVVETPVNRARSAAVCAQHTSRSTRNGRRIPIFSKVGRVMLVPKAFGSLRHSRAPVGSWPRSAFWESSKLSMSCPNRRVRDTIHNNPPLLLVGRVPSHGAPEGSQTRDTLYRIPAENPHFPPFFA